MATIYSAPARDTRDAGGSSSHQHHESNKRSRFHTIGGRNLLHDDGSHISADRATGSSRRSPRPSSSPALHSSRLYDWRSEYRSRDPSHDIKSQDRRSPSPPRHRHPDSSPRRQPLAPYGMSPPRKRSIAMMDRHEHVSTTLSGPPARRLSDFPQPQTGVAPYWHSERADHATPTLYIPRPSRPLPHPRRTEEGASAGYFQKPPGSSKGPFGGVIGADHPHRHESSANRRSISHSPAKSMFLLPDGLTDHTRSYLPPRERYGDHRPISPMSERPQTATVGYSSPAIVSPEFERSTAGAVASFFRRPSSNHSLWRQPYESKYDTPTEKDRALPDEKTYPGNSAQIVSPREPSPVPRREHPQAWFALGDYPEKREISEWPLDHVRAYDAGFEDALRAVEHGVFGLGGTQYRRPLLVKRQIPPESLARGYPPSSASSDSRRTAEPLHGRPTSRDYPPSSHPAPYPPYVNGQAPLLPPNPHGGSPYDFGYGPHHGYHASTRPDGGPYDPYYGPRVVYHPGHYPGLGVGLGRTQRQLISCYPCRGRKLKCDGQKPCAQCLRRGNEADCAYASHVRRRGKGKKVGDGDGSSEDSASAGAKTNRREGSRDSLGQSRGDPDGRSSRSDSELVEMTAGERSPASSPPNGHREELVEGDEGT